MLDIFSEIVYVNKDWNKVINAWRNLWKDWAKQTECAPMVSKDSVAQGRGVGHINGTCQS